MRGCSYLNTIINQITPLPTGSGSSSLINWKYFCLRLNKSDVFLFTDSRFCTNIWVILWTEQTVKGLRGAIRLSKLDKNVSQIKLYTTVLAAFITHTTQTYPESNILGVSEKLMSVKSLNSLCDNQPYVFKEHKPDLHANSYISSDLKNELIMPPLGESGIITCGCQAMASWLLHPHRGHIKGRTETRPHWWVQSALQDSSLFLSLACASTKTQFRTPHAERKSTV